MSTTADQDVLERLCRLPGFDLARGLAMACGKPSTYLDLMAELAESHGEDAALIAAHLTTGDTAAARRLAHRLKGTAGILGAERIAEIAAGLETMLEPTATWNGEVRSETERLGVELAALASLLRLRRETQ